MPDTAPTEAERRALIRTLARAREVCRARPILHPRRIAAMAALALAAAVAVLLVDMLEGVAARDVASAMAATSLPAILLAAIASGGSYAALIGFEWLALREAEAAVSPRLAALTGFISWSFTFVLGFGIVTGGAVRLRRYARAGLTTGQSLRVTLFGAVFFWLGIAALAGVSLILSPGVLHPLAGIPEAAGLIIGLIVLLAIGICICRGGGKVTLGGQALRLPAARTGAWIVALGVADTGLAALGLWCLLPAGTEIAFIAFLPVFAMATVAGVVSHAPGGVGAFEAVILMSVPGEPSALLGALLVFRLVYYVAPFSLGALGFAAAELAPQRHRLSTIPALLVPLLRPAVPLLVSAAVFAGGTVLLLCGAIPGAPWRMGELKHLLPLPFVEVSHLVSSMSGAALLIIGAGLKRQLRSSWIAAVALLSADVVFTLAKGFDFEQAGLCLALVVLLVLARDSFDRGGRILDAVTSRRIAAVAGAIALSVLVGAVTFGDDHLREADLWNVAFLSDAPRFLRATLGASALLALLLLWRAIHHPPTRQTEASDTGRIAAAVARAPDPSANLALLGDKRFLFDDAGGFIMYQARRGTFLAMGDPVAASRADARDLVWRFRELAHRNGAEPAFYQVTQEALPIYIEAGFSFVKLGEEALVDLLAFSMTGSQASRFRQIVVRAARAGLTFEIVPAAGVPPLLPALKQISDAWLARQSGREKGFSVGYWDTDYLIRFDHALVRWNGEPVAFATLWRAGSNEVAVDLMRYADDLPGGTMDFLFIALINALKAEGGERLSLGMAPLSGLAEHRLAPAWSRVGATAYRRCDAFFNFSGLRAFKAKFKPDWRPRYLAHTGRGTFARVMLDATLIISRPERDQRRGPSDRPVDRCAPRRPECEIPLLRT